MRMDSLDVNTDSRCTCIFMCPTLYKKHKSIFLLNVVFINYLYNQTLETLYVRSNIVFQILKKLSEGTFSHVVAHIRSITLAYCFESSSLV